MKVKKNGSGHNATLMPLNKQSRLQSVRSHVTCDISYTLLYILCAMVALMVSVGYLLEIHCRHLRPLKGSCNIGGKHG